jgi:transcriptional regulator with XRE-family HTH domain
MMSDEKGDTVMKFNHSRLKALRKKKKVSQEYLQSDLAKLGFRVSRVTLSHWERGKSKPTLEGIRWLAKYYGVTLEYFFA